MKNNYCLITNDVETTSIINHRLDDNIAKYLLEQGIPILLDLYAKYNIKTTFFFTGHIAKLCPKIVKMAEESGHEIASHGYTHDVNRAFDLLSFEKQKEHLALSKKIIEDIIGKEIISFRAPAARVNKNTAKALIETGFLVDSSVSSQRLDMFMSFGSIIKLNWLFTPRLPYFTDINNIFKKGDSQLLEVPISAFGLPYIGTFMRIAPWLNRVNRNILHYETKLNNRPFVFLTHPNEFIDEDREMGQIKARSKNYFSYLLGDLLRHKLKTRNLGKKAIPIFEKELHFFSKKSYIFVTMESFYYKHIKNN